MAKALAPVREWRIHLGAHKTATTHLQRSLEAHRESLVAHGVDFLHFRPFREVATPYIQPGSWKKRLWSPPMAGRFVQALDGLRQGPETVLLSDEDLLGYSHNLLDRPLYKTFRALHLVRALADRAERTEMFLCIRSLDGILPSAYAQALKAVPYPPGSMDRICREIAADPPSWVDLIARIDAAVPGVALRVWRYEDYRPHWRDLLTRFAGREIGTLPEVPAVKGTASPGPEGVARAEALDPGLPQRQRILTVREIYAAHPAGDAHGRLDPLTAEDKTRLQARYQEDLETIQKRWPEILIAPAREAA